MPDSTFSRPRSARPLLPRARRSVKLALYATVSFATVIASLTFGVTTAQATTPALSQAFSPSTIAKTGTSTLVVTITNPDGLQHKNLSFTDSLPNNLVVATGAANTEGTTCDSATITAQGSATTIKWSGQIAAGTGSCTVSVPVTAAVAGSYTNSSFTVSGSLTAPASATLTVQNLANQPTWPNVCDANAFGYLFQNQNADSTQPSTVSTVNIQNNTVTVVGTIADYVNAVGYNKKDQYMWGWDQSTEELVRIGSDDSLQEYPVSSIVDSDGNPMAAVNQYGFNIGDVSPTGKLYLASTYGNGSNTTKGSQRAVIINLTTPTPTLVYDGFLSPGSPVQHMADWAWYQGYLWGIGQTNAGDTALFATATSPTGGDNTLQVTEVADLSSSAIAAADKSPSQAGWGAVYLDSAGNLYANANPTGNLYELHLPALNSDGTPPTNARVTATKMGPTGSPVNGNDGARCPASSNPTTPTLTVEKDVVSYAAQGDQFELTVTQGGTVVPDPTGNSNPATTDVGTLGGQAQVGPLTVTSGTTYRIAESAANNTNTDLTQYTKAFACTDQSDDQTVSTTDVGNNGTAVTITIPSASSQVQCVVTNTAGPPTIEVHKTVDSRENSDDQFTLGLSGGTLGSVTPVTTDGPSTGPQTKFLGPITVDDGTTYTISETGANGATLSDYTQSYECDDSANGTETSGTTTDGQATYTVPASPTYSPDIVCTFSNDAIVPSISVTKTESSQTVWPGNSLTYTVTVSNTGTIPADGSSMFDNVPVGIKAFTSWVCTGSIIACPEANGSGGLNDTYTSFPVGQVFTYTVTATAADDLSQLSSVVNTATALPPASGTCTSSSGTSGVGLPCSAFVSATPVPATVSALKNVASVFDPADQFQVSLTGPSISTGNTALTTPNTTGEQAMVGPLSAAAGQTYTVSETALTGSLSNYSVALACVDTTTGLTVPTGSVQSTATTYSAQFVLPTGEPSEAAAVRCEFTNTAQFAHIVIAKTLTDPTQKLISNGPADFTVTVTNTGTIPADGSTIDDPIPFGLSTFTSWTCVASGGAVCPTDTTFVPGTGAIHQTIATFPVGGTLVYSIHGTAGALPPFSVTNIATATPPNHGFCGKAAQGQGCSASAVIDSVPLLTVSKTLGGRVNAADQFTISLSGGAITGSDTATTAGSSTGTGVAVIGPVQATIGTTYSLAETAVGTTDLAQYTKTYSCTDTANGNTIGSGTLATAGTSTTPVNITIPTGTAQVPNVACVIDNEPIAPVISITKSTSSALFANAPIVYVVTVSDAGVPADGTEVKDPVPAGIASFDSWTCTSAPVVGLCPNASSSAPGSIDETIADFPAGETFTYTIDATAANPLTRPTVTNQATATPPPKGTCSDGKAVPCVAQVTLQTNAPTIAAQKDVVSFVSNTDRFQVSITGGAITTGNTATTTAGTTGYQAMVGPLGADTSSTYTVAETAVSGTLSDYTVSYTCVDTANGNAPVASGSTSSVQLQVPAPPTAAAHVLCTFTNTALPNTVAVQKNVTAYYASTDQFEVRVDGNGITDNNTATTTVGVAGAHAALTPAVPATAGTSYTASERALSGSLSNYTTTYSCVDTANGNAPVASGSATSVQFQEPAATPPAQVLCTFTNTPRPTITITKSTTNTKIVPGGQVVYSVVVANVSPLLAAPNTVVDDQVPAGISSFASWTCDASGGAVCPTDTSVTPGSGPIHQTIATFPANSSVTYTIDAIAVVIPADPGNNPPVTNVATATPQTPGGCLVDNVIVDPPCTASVTTPVDQPTVTVDKNVVSYFAATDQFTVKVTGALITGRNTATTTPNQRGIQAQVTPLQAEASTQYTASETAAAGSLGNYQSDYECIDAANNGAVVAQGTSSTSVTFTVPTPAANAAHVECTFTNTALTPKIGIQKRVAETLAVPGSTVHYSVIVSNTGAASAAGTRVQDAHPVGTGAFTAWACSATGGALCDNAAGAGDIDETLPALPAGSSVTYSITASVARTAVGTITNIAYATPPFNGLCTTAAEVGGRCPASAAVPVDQPTVTVQKDVVSYYGAGDQFQVAVNGPGITSNNTANTTIGATGVTAKVTPALAAVPGDSYTVSESALVGSVTDYTVAYSCVDTANNNAVVTSGTARQSVSFVEPTPTAAAAHVVCTFTNTARPSISLAKTTSNTSVADGGPVHYEIVVTGTSVASSDGARLTDPIPTGISSFDSWTCTAAGGAVCPNATGSGALNETIATLPYLGTLTYAISATASSPTSATVTNTAMATPPTGGFCSTTGAAVCTASVSISPDPVITITKTANQSTVKPDDSIVYTVVVANSGDIDTNSVEVTDPIPSGITAFTNVICSGATGGAACPTVTSSGALDTTIGSFPVGATVTFVITARVSATPPANIENIASAIPATSTKCGPDLTAPPCVATVDTPSVPIVTVNKTPNLAGVVPGSVIVYTVTLTNVGNASADGSTFTDPIPAGLSDFSWTCSGTGGGICPTTSGTGGISETIATMPAGAVLTYTVSAQVTNTPPSPIVNTATLNPPPGGLCGDPGFPAPPCTSAPPVPVYPQISITKTANVASFLPSSTVVYTVTATNQGATAADGTTVSDPIPTGLDSFSWTCAAHGGAVCASAGGVGGINETIATFPIGSSLVYTVTATVSKNAPALITNIATADPPPHGLCMPGNTPPPCAATVVLTGPALAFTGAAITGLVQLGASALAGGGVILILLAIKRRRRGGKHAVS